MNRVILIGRITKDPEVRFTPGTGTAVTNITIAVDRYNPKSEKREADFIPVVVWGKQAEAVANYITKGKLIGISGRLQQRAYLDKSQNKKYVIEVVADEVQFLEWGDTNQFMTKVEDDDVPF